MSTTLHRIGLRTACGMALVGAFVLSEYGCSTRAHAQLWPQGQVIEDANRRTPIGPPIAMPHPSAPPVVIIQPSPFPAPIQPTPVIPQPFQMDIYTHGNQ